MVTYGDPIRAIFYFSLPKHTPPPFFSFVCLFIFVFWRLVNLAFLLVYSVALGVI